MASPSPRVCVTGGGGYVASWLVKLLLSRGYAVHATVRDPCDPKNAHLMQLDGAAESLRLFKADVLDRAALAAAVEGCEGVFHVASPVPADKIVDPESEVMEPAVKGTLNILEACSSMKVQKVVVVSSTSAVHFNPSWPQGKSKDESCWSDKKLCVENKLWYCVAKTVAEETALEYGEKNGLNVVTVCPCIVFGPQLQPIVNTSSELLVYVTKGGPNAMFDMLLHIVDVRDVADALLLVYEKPESSGRYISAPNYINTRALLELLKKTYPNYNYVKCKANVDQNPSITPISSAKLKNLGWKPRELEETLLDSIEYYRKTGILQDAEGEGQACRLPDLFQFFHAGDPKNACLGKLDGASANLRLFKADMLDYDTVVAAFAGCEGVFHVATPVPEQKMVDPQKEMMDPTVKGTMNVLKACSATTVKKLVLVSSAASLCFNPDWPEDKIKDESCWSDKEFCRENENWYSLAKTEAEEMSLEYGEKNGLHVATFCPGLVFGPLLQHVALNTSSKVLLYIIRGGPDTMNNNFWPTVDVRDVADALLLLYNKAGPSERYICALDQMDIKDLLRILKGVYPNYNYADKMVDVGCKAAMTSAKLKNLGWRPRKLEDMLADSIESYEKAGLLQVSDGKPCRLPFFYRMPPVQE